MKFQLSRVTSHDFRFIPFLKKCYLMVIITELSTLKGLTVTYLSNFYFVSFIFFILSLLTVVFFPRFIVFRCARVTRLVDLPRPPDEPDDEDCCGLGAKVSNDASDGAVDGL